MAAADTARLIASLELDNRKFQRGAAGAIGSIDRIDRRLGAFSGAINRNLGRLVDSAVTRGTQLLVDGIQGGIDSLAQLEDATTSVDGAIKQMGLTGQVTSAQIAGWANEIEASTQAAFDDKDITRNAATLIRYGRVSAQNLRPALEVMTDLAAKTGSVDSASTLLARALADPAKAAGKLSRAGVILTKQQQDQIKALVKAGKLGKAQAVVLAAIGTATKNAARDSKGAFGDMQNQLADTKEDAERLLGEAAFPVLQKIGTKLTEALADPRTMAAIKGLGQGAAQALDKIVDFATKVPWGSIADGLGKAAGFAGDLITAFATMPPEVQAILIGLVGLNKLTGGAVTGIVSELGKGLIKGVLGMTAGVVNINAGVVKGPGGLPVGGSPGGVGAGAAGGLLGTVGLTAATMTGLTVGIGAAVVAGIATSDAIDRKGGLGPALAPSRAGGISLGTNVTVKDAEFSGTRFLGGKGSSLIVEGTAGKPATDKKLDELKTAVNTSPQALAAKVEAAKAAQVQAIRDTGSTTGINIRGTTSAVATAQGAITSAIAANKPIVTTNVDVNITSTGVARASVTSNRYGPSEPAGGGSNGKYIKT